MRVRLAQIVNIPIAQTPDSGYILDVSDAVLDRVRALREMGATKVRVSADGAVEADFGPADSSRDDDQHDKSMPTVARPKSATAGLVPRGADS